MHWVQGSLRLGVMPTLFRMQSQGKIALCLLLLVGALLVDVNWVEYWFIHGVLPAILVWVVFVTIRSRL